MHFNPKFIRLFAGTLLNLLQHFLKRCNIEPEEETIYIILKIKNAPMTKFSKVTYFSS